MTFNDIFKSSFLENFTSVSLLDMLLTLAVRERDFVLGKFFGVLVQTVSAILVSALLSVSLLAIQAPQALGGIGFGAFLLAVAALFVQSVLWCAVGVALGAMFRHAAVVICASFLLTVVFSVRWVIQRDMNLISQRTSSVISIRRSLSQV